MYVSSFTIIKIENDNSLQKYGIITWWNKFLLILKNSNITACYPNYPSKGKVLFFFLALNDDIEKNKLLKTFLRNKFMNLKILHT